MRRVGLGLLVAVLLAGCMPATRCPNNHWELMVTPGWEMRDRC